MQVLPDARDCVRVNLFGTIAGVAWANTVFVRHTPATPNQADMQALADALNAWWNSNLVPIVNSVTKLTQVKCTDIGSRTGVVAINTVERTGNGVLVPVPNNVCYCVGFQIARRYRGGHPRIYQAGIAQSQMNGQTQLTSSARTGFINAWNAFRTTLSGLSLTTLPALQQVNVSYYSGKGSDGKPALRVEPVIDAVSAAKGDLRVDTQRHRLGRPA